MKLELFLLLQVLLAGASGVALGYMCCPRTVSVPALRPDGAGMLADEAVLQAPVEKAPIGSLDPSELGSLLEQTSQSFVVCFPGPVKAPDPVRLTATRLKLGQLLRLISYLNPQISFQIRNGTIFASCEMDHEQSDSVSIERSYPVGDLLRHPERWFHRLPNGFIFIRNREAAEEAFGGGIRALLNLDGQERLIGNDLITQESPERQAQIADLFEVLRRIADDAKAGKR